MLTPSKRIFRQNSQYYMYIRRVYPVRFLGVSAALQTDKEYIDGIRGTDCRCLDLS